MSKTDEEIIEEVVFTMRDWIRENHYATIYPNRDNVGILIDDPAKSEGEHKRHLDRLQECGIMIIIDNILQDGRHITAIDDINGDYRKLMKDVSRDYDNNKLFGPSK